MSEYGRLTEKQRQFVEAYMGEAGGNGTEAARLAGYSGTENTLAQVAHTNIRKPKIQAAIRERVQQDPLVADRRERQAFWTKILRGEEDEASIKDRLQASKLLGKSQADFVERHEHSGPGGDPIQVQDVTLSDAELAKIAAEEGVDEALTEGESHENGHATNGHA